MELTFTAIDIETTGLSPENDKIIEIGAVKFRNKEVVETFTCFIQPGIMVPSNITELTGITNEMLIGAKSEKEVMEEFLAFVDTEVILGHNVLFDFSFLKVAAKRHGFIFEKKAIDTLSLSREFHAGLPSKSLTNMCKHYNIATKQSHRAYDDALASAELFYKLYEAYHESNEDEFVEKPIFFQPKKQEPMTMKQKKYLMDLMRHHKLELTIKVEELTKSEASKLIDNIILNHGMIQRG